MISKFEIDKIDWENPDVNQVFEHFSARFDQIDKENGQQADVIKQQAETIRQQNELIKKLEDVILQLKTTRHTSKRSKSYNVRTFKEYPRPGKTTTKRNHNSVPVTRHEIADILYCPTCGNLLSDITDTRTRNVEDVIDGKWQNTIWTLNRRYCKSCDKQHNYKIPGLLRYEHFGTTIMAQIAVMRSLGISFGKICKLIHMIYGRFISISTLESICGKVAKMCRAEYNRLVETLRSSLAMYGDETGWFFIGKHYWVWVFRTGDTVIYHIASTRSKLVAEAILRDFDGIMVSDSHPIWSGVGGIHQRCLLHYFRDMYLTLKENDSKEYKSFFNRLHKILKDAISVWEDSNGKVSEGVIQSLQKRLDRLASGKYDDVDCNRFAKRLQKERNQLLTFLSHDVDYHNNNSEQSLRVFANMRKILYGNRSMAGMETTETLMSIYSTCEMRNINPYEFFLDHLNGVVKEIPLPKSMPAIAS